MTSKVALCAIYCHPIKSCGAILLESADLDEYGLVNDRRWMAVDEAGQFLSQRDWPRMALIRPQIASKGLELSAPGVGPLFVPNPSEKALQRPVAVWRSRCLAADAGEEVAQWLSDFMGMRCRLVRMGPAYQRLVNGDFALQDDQVSFADGFPFLLASSASLEELNSRLEEPLSMNRFRPNLVIRGAEAFAEDQWKQIKMGNVVFHAVKPCARCTVTTVDQTTGQRGKEPLATLATYRKTADGRILFGQNLIHQPKRGRLRVGDAVEVLSTH